MDWRRTSVARGAGPASAGSIHLAGARLDLLTTEQLTAKVIDLARSGATSLVANHNLHSLYLMSVTTPTLKDVYDAADIVHIDGMSLCALARLAGLPARRAHRTTYLDWVGPLLSEAAMHDLRVFLLGSEAEVVEKAAERLTDAIQRPIAIGWSHGYFDAGDENALREVENSLAQFRPDLVLVGMGMPRQELWWHERRDHLPHAAYLMAGGCFDYLAGRTATPPRFLGRVGLEWLYRLARDPKRLARRYIFEPLHLIARLSIRLAKPSKVWRGNATDRPG